MAFRVEINGFLPGEHNLNRPLYFQCCQCCDMLRGDVLLAAETASDQFVLHHNLSGSHPSIMEISWRVIDSLV